MNDKSEESEEQTPDLMRVLSDPKKMSVLMNLFAIFQKAQSVTLDVSIWVNGVKKAEVEDVLKDFNLG